MDQTTHNPDNDSILAVIRYHCNGPQANDPLYLFDPSENAARATYYNLVYIPWAFIDGNLNGGGSPGTWIVDFNNEQLIDADASISLSGDYNPVTDSGHVTVTIITENAPGLSNLKLRVAIIENGIYHVDPNGERYHNQTFRDMIPNTSGQAVTLTVGDTLQYTFPFITRTPMVSDSCEIIAFIQSDSGHRVVQAAKIAIRTLLDPTGINDRAEIPKEFSLQQNYPNPFNAQTQIGFNTKGGAVKLEVFNITGAKVTTLIDANLAGGHHTIIWDGRDSRGTSVSSGVYFYRLIDPAGSQVRRMTLLK